MPLYYMRVEAVNLDHFVYDTHDISTIRGGSFILLEAIEGINQEFKGRLHPITEAASQGLFSFDGEENDAEKLKAEVLAHLQKRTNGQATFVAVVERDEGNFPLVLERLEAQVRRQQWRRPTIAIPEFLEAAQQCFLDGWRPGIVRYLVDPTVTDVKISKTTHWRRERGRELKHKLFPELLKDDEYEIDLCAKDLGELALDATQGVLSGKIAFIHVDGNSFGHIRRELCLTPESRQQFDLVIQAGFRTPFLQTLLQRARQDPDFQTENREKPKALRLEVLLWGGDEMTLVVPAWKGWEVLQLFFEQAKGLTFGDVPLSHRAVIIFCHHNAPILQIRQLADNLMDRAKADIQENLENAVKGGRLSSLDAGEQDKLRARFPDHHYGDAFHYLTLESFDMLRGSLDSFITRYYQEASYSSLLLYAHEMNKLREHLKTIHANVARSKILEVIGAMRAGQPARIQTIIEQAYSLLSGDRRRDTREAVEWLTKDNPARWYILADLWDYIPAWK
ncbi:MAG: hypothetical protein AB1791_00055 [Chloroflexota bacterium]